MQKLVASGLFALALASWPAFAHEGKSHIMGTVTAVASGSFDVKTAHGAVTTVRVNAGTKYRDQDGDSTDVRPAVGSRVVVDLEGTGHDQSAGQVRFATAKKPGDANKAHSDHDDGDHAHADHDDGDDSDGGHDHGDTDKDDGHHGDHSH